MLRWLVLLALLCCAALARAAQPLLWELADDKGARLWLYGSVHLCRADCYPLPAEVLRRFEAAELLAVEIDLTRADIAEHMQRALAAHPKDTLRELLKAEELAALHAALKSSGIDAAALQRLSPQWATMLLALNEALRLGLSPAYGLDLQWIQRARAAGKPVLELETLEQQIAALHGGKPEAALSALRSTLAASANGQLRAMLEAVISAWKAGDVEALAALLQESAALEAGGAEAFEALYTRRNHAMSERIAALAAAGTRAFVVVGSAHLAGPAAIPELLQKKGFKLRRVGGAAP